jgi:hypothetical protein
MYVIPTSRQSPQLHGVALQKLEALGESGQYDPTGQIVWFADPAGQ